MKLVIISDTHNLHNDIKLPEGDILIHCGDYTTKSTVEEFEGFFTWLKDVENNYKKVLIIPGNHDHWAGEHPYEYEELLNKYTKNTIDLWLKTYRKKKVYEFAELTFFGFPYVPFSFDANCFFLERKNHKKLINNILKANVIVTHGPPAGIMDKGGRNYMSLGSSSLFNKIFELKPTLNCFGHIHEQGAIEKIGEITFVNASILDEHYELTKEPTVVEL